MESYGLRLFIARAFQQHEIDHLDREELFIDKMIEKNCTRRFRSVYGGTFLMTKISIYKHTPAFSVPLDF